MKELIQLFFCTTDEPSKHKMLAITAVFFPSLSKDISHSSDA